MAPKMLPKPPSYKRSIAFVAITSVANAEKNIFKDQVPTIMAYGTVHLLANQFNKSVVEVAGAVDKFRKHILRPLNKPYYGNKTSSNANIPQQNQFVDNKGELDEELDESDETKDEHGFSSAA